MIVRQAIVQSDDRSNVPMVVENRLPAEFTNAGCHSSFPSARPAPFETAVGVLIIPTRRAIIGAGIVALLYVRW